MSSPRFPLDGDDRPMNGESGSRAGSRTGQLDASVTDPAGPQDSSVHPPAASPAA